MISGGMNGLDLFSGIGGITKALEGYVKPIAYCEIDRYARGVLLSRMSSGDLPIAPIWDDVQTLYGSLLPPVDIIYGGFPCQDISVAGKQIGLDGKRSGLFFEILRLAQEIRPSFIFLENVPNIRTKGLDRVVNELAEIGYDCRWDTLSAADVGANHKRERWFLLAHTYSEGQSGLSWGTTPEIIMSGISSQDVANASREPSTQKDSCACTVGEDGQPRADDCWSHGRSLPRNDWWLSEPSVGRVVDGVPKRVDRLRALGNAVVPAQAREAFERLMGLK